MAKYYTDPVMGQLRAAFEKTVMQWPQVRMKKMFNCPCYQAGGKLFVILVNNGVVFAHLPAEQLADLGLKVTLVDFEASEKPGTVWPQAPLASKADLAALLPYIQASYRSALEDR